MSISTEELRALPVSEKLRIVELLWDDLGSSTSPLPLPEWVTQEAARRSEEMRIDPALGISHDEVWRRIDNRNG